MFFNRKTTDRVSWEQRLLNLWYKKTISVWLLPLAPLSLLMKIVAKLRFYACHPGKKVSINISIPVIIAGNITIGGSGKTPLVHALFNHLSNRGLKPGILSRGYGSTNKVFPAQVFPDSDPSIFGDEPVLLAQRTGCPVVIDPDRPRGAKMLAEQSGCNVIISDDGLQHYRLARDIEMVIIDGKRGLGNHYCIPAGPLREPAERLQTVDFVISKGEWQQDFAIPHYTMQLHGECVKNILSGESLTLQAFADKYPQIHGVAGIGHPDVFFTTLRQAGLRVITHPFPDHHHYHANDLLFDHHCPIIMTEKDAVKCKKFAHKDMWYYPVNGLLEQDFWESFDTLFNQRCNRCGQ
ncbi:MAG: tetraacyldisaccharide 4'-kinase [Endozoicomonadaceae bacterium]|nr:tetraacyldisaccharide 4'-kinase [Endozoicomonadaceae bacterium]